MDLMHEELVWHNSEVIKIKQLEIQKKILVRHLEQIA